MNKNKKHIPILSNVNKILMLIKYGPQGLKILTTIIINILIIGCIAYLFIDILGGLEHLPRDIKQKIKLIHLAYVPISNFLTAALVKIGNGERLKRIKNKIGVKK